MSAMHESNQRLPKGTITRQPCALKLQKFLFLMRLTTAPLCLQ